MANKFSDLLEALPEERQKRIRARRAELEEKWREVLEADELPPIKGSPKVTPILLKCK
jgi:hypothetical protein